jgi:uncharacterized membrane protein
MPVDDDDVDFGTLGSRVVIAEAGDDDDAYSISQDEVSEGGTPGNLRWASHRRRRHSASGWIMKAVPAYR